MDFFCKMALSHKWLVVEQNGLKFGSGIVAKQIWDTFDLVGFKVILRSLGAFVTKWAASQKRLIIERNGVKFGTRGY